VAQRVETAVRPGDTAARLGGDEFAILLEDVEGKEDAEAVCRRLLELLAEPVHLGQASPTIGASIGVAISGHGGETVDELLRNADIAMYAAKAAGRGQVVFFRSELLDLAAARSELAALLRGAEARGELQLHFQPIVALESGAPVGLEALVRWQPQGHMLHMPAEFIGLAEETGEILAIGRWVLAEACRRAKSWQERFALPDLRIYVNLSARQFRDPGLLAIVAGALRDAHLEAHHLTLEITETALLTRTPETLERIGHLRRLGVRLAIDDFGTGYSSLGYLHAFQVDELKIDRSFVSGYRGVAGGADGTEAETAGGSRVDGVRATPRRDAKVLSRAIVELGRALSLDMVAEGIETESQAAWFRELGCRYGQGFYYAKPLAPTDVERFLRRRVRLAKLRPDGGVAAVPNPAVRQPGASGPAASGPAARRPAASHPAGYRAASQSAGPVSTARRPIGRPRLPRPFTPPAA
jgi:predicted signal transduction protein with EAL and GGDEF domain